MSAPVGSPSLLLALCALLCMLIVVQSAYCPDPYKRYSQEHSYCVGVCCSCPKYRRGVSPWLKQELVRLHNNLRSKVAGGKSYGVDHLPRATNMLEMVWDDELAEVAQRWSDKCERNSDCENCRRVGRFGVGQIIFEFDGKMDGEDIENEFFSRFQGLQSFRKDQVARFTAGTNPKTAQILWAKTWRIGCGFLDFNYPGNGRRYTQIVCNYGPKGSVEGEEVYKGGSVCSSCPANTCCGDACKKHNLKSNYDGLCKVIDENLPPEGNVPHKKTGNEVFYCGFNDESDCSHTVEGVDRWIRNVTTGGTWLNTYLGNYGYTVLKFNQPIISKSGKLCLAIRTRSGPMEAGQPYRYQLSGLLEEEGKFSTSLSFPPADDNVKHRFHTDYFQPSEFPKNRGAKLTLNFSVGGEGPKQYFEIDSIVALEKDCPKKTITEGTGFITSR